MKSHQQTSVDATKFMDPALKSDTLCSVKQAKECVSFPKRDICTICVMKIIPSRPNIHCLIPRCNFNHDRIFYSGKNVV